MDYVERNLRKDEQIVLRAKINWLALIVPFIATIFWEVVCIFVRKALDDALFGSGDEDTVKAIVTAVFQLAAFAPLLVRILVLLTTKLVITNKRVVGKVGILKVDTIDFPIEKVDNVTYNANIAGNIFKYYTVVVTGTSGDKKTVKMVANALNFKNAVNEAIERHAEEARKAQASEIAAAMNNKAQM